MQCFSKVKSNYLLYVPEPSRLCSSQEAQLLFPTLAPHLLPSNQWGAFGPEVGLRGPLTIVEETEGARCPLCRRTDLNTSSVSK